MIIINNYEGSSIDIIKIDNITNTAHLGLKDENGKASHYYNFIARNEKEKKGKIIIENINNSMYYSKDMSQPFIKKQNKWEKISSSNYKVLEDKIEFYIEPNSEQEISLVPRYTIEDLKKFCEIKNIKYEKNTIIKIELGNINKPTIFIIGRQHPGETLSSFFIEGIINKILNDTEILQNYHFQIYPIVNIAGVKEGRHRFINSIDYNRCWNNINPPTEINYLKQQLSNIKEIECFIDVHNDEISTKDYIRMKKPKKPEIAGIMALEAMSNLKRFARALIKQGKIINISKMTARDYVEKKYKCKSILVELSMNDELNEVYIRGEKFIEEICKNERKR